MDRKAAWAVATTFPFLAVVFYTTTRVMPPLIGYLVGLAMYWIVFLVPLIVWRGGFGRVVYTVTMPRMPLVFLNAVMIIAVGVAAAIALQSNPLSPIIFAFIFVAALLNGTLEEVFWRGTILNDDAKKSELMTQLALFTAWHIALLFADGVTVTGGAFGLLGGAFIAGVLWTWTRMQTGSVGFGIIGHVGLNLVAFTELAAQNPI